MKSISLISGYLFLISAIITGIAANGYLKTTEGFTKLNPTIFCILSIVVCIFSYIQDLNQSSRLPHASTGAAVRMSPGRSTL